MSDRVSRVLPLVVFVGFLTSACVAQSAGYQVFAEGCKGNGRGPVTCVSINANGGTNNTVSLLNEYCYGFKAPVAMQVIGFQFFTQTFSKTIPTTMRTAIYRSVSATKLEPRQISDALGSMRVEPKAQFYTAYLPTAVSFAKDEAFWVSGWDSTLIRAAGITSGSAPALPTFWRANPGNSSSKWGVTGIVKYPAVRVLCLGAGSKGAIPRLTHTGLPKLGSSFSVEIHQALASQPAQLLFGLSSTRWGSLPLPFDMTRIGAPGCVIQVAGDFRFSMGNTNASGSARFTFGVPNQPAIAGIPFFHQAFVIDPTNNALGLAVTNAGFGIAGK